jgi:hypothetical protein
VPDHVDPRAALQPHFAPEWRVPPTILGARSRRTRAYAHRSTSDRWVNAKLTCADCAPMHARTGLRVALQVCPTLEAKPEATDASLDRPRNSNQAQDHRLAGCRPGFQDALVEDARGLPCVPRLSTLKRPEPFQASINRRSSSLNARKIGLRSELEEQHLAGRAKRVC